MATYRRPWSAVMILTLAATITSTDSRRHSRQNGVPRFQSPQYVLRNVTENTPTNTALISLPASGARNVRYSVSDNRRFRIDQDGNVYAKTSGRELASAGVTNFTVFAVSPDDSSRVASTTVLLSGNKPPQFSEDSYEANVFENAAEGSLVRAVVAHDPDTDPISYSIKLSAGQGDTEEYKMFTINHQTGVIRLVTQPFNFSQDVYRFTVVARDTHGQDDTAVVTVHIIDVNNHRPEFPDCDQYRPQVEENKDAGTLIVRVKATDADKGQNAELTYSLVTSPSSPETFFNIDSKSGMLTTGKSFNRDEPDHEKELRVLVKASDKGKPSLEGTCAFTVYVQDVNDNAPLFDAKNYVEVVAKDAKPGTRVEHVSAVDNDINENGNITYSLSAEYPADALEYFNIDHGSGVVSLLRPLAAFDINSEFRLVAVATDQGSPPLSDQAPVIITVKDSSSQPPSFTVLPDPTYYLPENYRDTETAIARVRAVSNQPGNSKIYYDIKHGTQEHTNKFRTFVIEEDGDGGATIKYGGSRPLDYERLTAYNLTIVATTEQQTKAETTFRVELQDRNDEVPIFYDTDRVTVPENSPPGTFVGVVTAVDGDSTSPNNQVTYSLDRNSEEFQLFSIESSSGRVSTRVRLDREDKSRSSPFYTIPVIAEDGAPSDITNDGKPNQAKQRITVEVGDVNDNPPSFPKPGISTVSIFENADVGSKVFDIIATDVDTDSEITYQITDGNYGAAFDIRADTGAVSVKNKIDYETVKEYNITVTASDGKYEDSHKVTVKVRNKNDVAPQFDSPSYEREMSEGSVPRTPIIQVKAVDTDPTGEPSVIYKLSGPGVYDDHPEDNVFSINAEGEVIVLKMLDRDEGTGGREVWDLSVLAWEDGGKGLASSVPFRLTLKDINDNAPYLIQSNTSLPVIMENKDPEGVTIPVEADDFDDHVTNGPPYRFLLDPSADSDILKKFSVKTVGVSGEDQRAEIRPLVKLDREEHKQYIIPVIVSDSKKAEPRSMTGTSLFTVIVGDENDNPMKPGSSTIQVFNLEGAMPDTVVGRVFVEDPDDWDLPDKTFSWLTGQDRDHFQLDTDTGYITMKYGTPNGTYPLRFQVHDKKFDSEVDADVTVVVRLLPREAVIQSGSVRIRGVSAEGFVSSPDKNTPSLYERMIPELASLLGTSPENVDLFGVQDSGTGGVDVRYAAHGSPYYDSERLNGLVGMNQKRIEEVLKIEIEQVGIDDCIYETTCRGSCFSGLEIYDKEVYKVQTNRSSIVAVRTAMRYTCGECHQPVTPVVCLNGGHLMNSKPPRCECPDGYAGPNCESLTIHFKGDGYAWFPHLTACNASHMSFDLTTSASQGLVMYNGPLAEPAGGVQDFFAVDVVKGRLRVFLNYGTGTAVASPESRVDDGRLHHVEVNWNTEGVAVLIDSCVGNGPCQALTPASSSGGAQNAFLNVATPLQLGGSAVPLDNIRALMTWMVTPTSAGFTGCLQNVTFLDKVYNLGQPAYGEEYSSYCEENHQPMPVIYANSGFLAALLCCVIIVLGLLVAVLLYRRTRQRKHYTGSNHELRQSIVQSTEEGDPEKDAKYDLAALQVEQRKETAGPAGDAGLHRPTGSAATIDGRKSAADADDAVCPADDLRNYVYEGKGSSAGSLSTINSGSDDGDQSFEYLQELGPRFRRLADLYGDEADQSDSDSGRPFRTGHTVAESWC